VIDTATNTVIDTVGVGQAPEQVAITPSGASAYVTNFFDDTVTEIDTATNTLVDTVAVGNAPIGIAVTPDGTKLYVGNLFDDNVSVIEAATNTVVGTVPVGDGPVRIAIADVPSPTPTTPQSQGAAGSSEDPKCERLRRKLMRQRRNRRKADSEGKRSQLDRNIAETQRRLRKLNCAG
jgi:YVTN family beta-propeller protein